MSRELVVDPPGEALALQAHLLLPFKTDHSVHIFCGRVLALLHLHPLPGVPLLLLLLHVLRPPLPLHGRDRARPLWNKRADLKQVPHNMFTQQTIEGCQHYVSSTSLSPKFTAP